MTGLAANVTSTQAVISLRSYLTPIGATQTSILNYTSADGLTAAAGATLTLTFAASATNQEINLGSLFAAYTAPIFVSIADITNPGVGFHIYTGAGGGTFTKMQVGANGWLAWLADGATALNPVYVDNVSSSSELVLSIGVMTQ